ncbi:MAG: alanine racemase [Bdellovibrionota bacterium]
MKKRSPAEEFLAKAARLGALRDEDAPFPPRIQAEFSAKALRQNYSAIRDQVRGQAILPMIKANAYGHGWEWTAKELLDLPDLYGYGVATLEEGRMLRVALGPRERKRRIIVFSGTAPWSEQKGHYCQAHGLTPVIATDDDWKLFFRQKWPGRIPYELKFNTGMNRLGISPSLAIQIVQSLKPRPVEERPEAVLSHLAMAEAPTARLTEQQIESFMEVRNAFSHAFSATQFHLANSAAIWNAKAYRLSEITDAVRPGLALYGIPPWKGAPVRGIEPVVTIRAAVIATRRLKAGDSIGYSGTFRVSGKAGDQNVVHAAILSAGYADGIKRSLSNQGHVWINGQATRFIGNVSMDLSAIQCPPSTKPGDWAEILGPRVDPWAQAEAAGTIPYELLTSIADRVHKTYE